MSVQAVEQRSWHELVLSAELGLTRCVCSQSRVNAKSTSKGFSVHELYFAMALEQHRAIVPGSADKR